MGKMLFDSFKKVEKETNEILGEGGEVGMEMKEMWRHGQTLQEKRYTPNVEQMSGLVNFRKWKYLRIHYRNGNEFWGIVALKGQIVRLP